MFDHPHSQTYTNDRFSKSRYAGTTARPRTQIPKDDYDWPALSLKSGGRQRQRPNFGFTEGQQAEAVASAAN